MSKALLRAVRVFCLICGSAFFLIWDGNAYAGPRSIVGRWALDPSNCTPVGGMIHIEPLRMIGDEFQCKFDTVSRTGETVVWQGSCGFPEPFEKATVVARTTGSALHVRFNREDSGPYFRCEN